MAFTMIVNGGKAGLTAGHCGQNDSVYMGTNRGKYVGDMFNDGEHGQDVVVSDTSLITIHEHDNVTRNVFIKRDFSRLVDLVDRDVDVGVEVCMSGSKNGIDCGKVTRKATNLPSEGGYGHSELRPIPTWLINRVH